MNVESVYVKVTQDWGFPDSHTILCNNIHVCMHITLCTFCVLMVCPGRQICPLRLHHRFLILLKVFSLGKFSLTGIEGLRTEGVAHRTDCKALWRLCYLWLSAHKLNWFEYNWTLLSLETSLGQESKVSLMYVVIHPSILPLIENWI